MRVSYDKSGAQVQAASDYPIAAATVVAEGQSVKLSSNLIIPCVQGEIAAIVGVAAEGHTGISDGFTAANGHISNGTLIRVYDSASAVSESVAPQVTATSGSTTTLAVSTLPTTYVAADFVGGYMKLISKGTNSANTDSLGTVYPITAYTPASGTFTTTQAAGGAITSGDVFAIFPAIGFAKGQLDSNIQRLDLSANSQTTFRVVGYDTARNALFTIASLHQSGNKLA